MCWQTVEQQFNPALAITCPVFRERQPLYARHKSHPQLIIINMKRKLFFLVPIIFSSGLLTGQTLSPQVTSSSGNGGTSLSWSVGQIACNTISSNSSILTQGFQQSDYKIISSVNSVNSTNEILFYPNPTKDLIIIHSKLQHKQNIDLYDNNGKVVYSSNFSGDFQIDLSKHKTGTYLLKISSETFKIIKQ